MCAKLLEIIGIGKVQMRAADVIFHILGEIRKTAPTAVLQLFQNPMFLF
jgi:alpha-galactosidase/6-phospho-beta-glucosidase family protein